MTIVIASPGSVAGPYTHRITAAACRAYAEATNDANPLYETAHLAPPVYGVVPSWEAVVEVGRALIPGAFLPRLVHEVQDMHFKRPLIPGEVLVSRAELFNVRVNRLGVSVCVRAVSSDEAGKDVLEIFTTSLVRGLPGCDDDGPDAPVHAFNQTARERPFGTTTLMVDQDQPYRYAEASGDVNPIHVNPDAARAAGFPGVISHGLCTMAMCAQAVFHCATTSDPSCLRRLAVRFVRPVFPGSDLRVSIFDAGVAAGRRALAFEAHSRRKVVVKDGRAEFVPPR